MIYSAMINMAGLSLGAIIDDSIYVMLNYYHSDARPSAIDAQGNFIQNPPTKFRVYKIGTADSLQNTEDYMEWPVEYGAPINFDGTPEHIGDQTLFTVFTDQNDEPNRNKLKAEINLTSWAWKELNDVIMMRWRIINKSSHTWNDAVIAIPTDCELFDAHDDLVGSDSTLSMVYCYNADVDGMYTNTAVAMQFLETPSIPMINESAIRNGSVTTNFMNVQALSPPIYKHNDYTQEMRWTDFLSNSTNKKIYHHMLGIDNFGDPIINPVTGQSTKWAFNGDPVHGTGWIELPIHALDRRFMISTGPFDMAPGDTQYVAVAITVGNGPKIWDDIRSIREMGKVMPGVYHSAGTVHMPDLTVDPDNTFIMPILLTNPGQAVCEGIITVKLPESLHYVDITPAQGITIIAQSTSSEEIRLQCSFSESLMKGGSREIAQMQFSIQSQSDTTKIRLFPHSFQDSNGRPVTLMGTTANIEFNHSPSHVSLLSPINGWTADHMGITFKWTQAHDLDDDSLSYHFQWIGQDIASLTTSDTSVFISLADNKFKQKDKWQWTILAGNGSHTYQVSDTLSFSIPDNFFSKNIKQTQIPTDISNNEIISNIFQTNDKLVLQTFPTDNFQLSQLRFHKILKSLTLQPFFNTTLENFHPSNFSNILDMDTYALIAGTGNSILYYPGTAHNHAAAEAYFTGKLHKTDDPHHIVDLTNHELRVWDLSTLSNPGLINQFIFSESSDQVYFAWPYLFSIKNNGLSIYELDKTSLTLLSTINLNIHSHQNWGGLSIPLMAYDKNRLVIIADAAASEFTDLKGNPLYQQTLIDIDYSDILNPKLINQHRITGNFTEIELSSHYLTAAGWTQFSIFDLSKTEAQLQRIAMQLPDHFSRALLDDDGMYYSIGNELFFIHNQFIPLDQITKEPDKFSLKNNFPNPFHSITFIPYYLKNSSDPRVEIFNILGKKVCTIQNLSSEKNWQLTHWDGCDDNGSECAAGVYICRLTVGEKIDTIKIIKY